MSGTLRDRPACTCIGLFLWSEVDYEITNKLLKADSTRGQIVMHLAAQRMCNLANIRFSVPHTSMPIFFLFFGANFGSESDFQVDILPRIPEMIQAPKRPGHIFLNGDLLYRGLISASQAFRERPR